MSNSLWPRGLYSPWNSPRQNTRVDSLSLLQGIFPTQGSNPGLPHYRWILYQLGHKRSPRLLEWVAYPFSSGSFQPRNWTGVSCIAGGLYQLSYQGSPPVGYTIKTLQATGFCDGGHLGKSKIHRSGCQEGEMEGNFHIRSEATLHTWNFYFKKSSTLLLRLFNWLDQEYPDYLEYIHLPKVSWFFFQLYRGVIDKLLHI